MTVIQWVCASCGRLAVELRIPPLADPVKYRPVRCGRCQGTTFTQHEVKAA